jgi:hypothetical protein
MYDHILEEMADAISKELHVDNNDVLGILNRYWQDKIAHVWQVDDMLECAHNTGKPITRTDAAGLLHNVFDHHDSSMGISWTSLDVALEDYHFDLKVWPEEKYDEVHGVFKAWRKGSLIAHQFGTFPHKMDGNLLDALECAKAMTKEIPNVPVFIGCETRFSEDTEPWLTIILPEGETEPIIEESAEPCTQSNLDNASAS